MNRSIAQHWKGTNAYLYMLKREQEGEPVLVDQDEAERRAAVCASGNKGRRCPQNVAMHKTWLERKEDEAMADKLGGRTTTRDGFLGSCAVCSCNLKSLVHMLPEVIMHGADAKFLDSHPSICWKHQFKKST